MAQLSPEIAPFRQYRLLAGRHRARADNELLPNVRRMFEVSAERWELLAERNESLAKYADGRSSVSPALAPLPAPPDLPKSIRSSTLVFDPARSIVRANDARIRLTEKQYALLDFLMVKEGATVSRTALLDHLYVRANRPEPKIIDVLVCILRKKLAPACDGEKCIETVRGAGYRLSMPQAA